MVVGGRLGDDVHAVEGATTTASPLSTSFDRTTRQGVTGRPSGAGPTRRLRQRPVRAWLSQELPRAAQPGRQMPLSETAVQPDIERPGHVGAGTPAGWEPRRIESVPPRYQAPELISTHRVGPCCVVSSRAIGSREFQKGRRQITHMHRAAHVVGEQHPIRVARGKCMHHVFVCGAAVTDYQRSAHDHRPGIDCGRLPVRLAEGRVDDDVGADRADQAEYGLTVTDVERQPLGSRHRSRPSQVCGGHDLTGRRGLPYEFAAEKAAAAHDENSHSCDRSGRSSGEHSAGAVGTADGVLLAFVIAVIREAHVDPVASATTAGSGAEPTLEP